MVDMLKDDTIDTSPIARLDLNLWVSRLIQPSVDVIRIQATWLAWVVMFVGIGSGAALAWWQWERLDVFPLILHLFLCFFAFLFFVSGVCLFLQNMAPLVCDRRRGEFWMGGVPFHPYRLWGRFRKPISLAEVIGVQLLDKNQADLSTGVRIGGELNLVLREGRRVHLYSSGNMEDLERSARRLAGFLGKPVLASPHFVQAKQGIWQDSEVSTQWFESSYVANRVRWRKPVRVGSSLELRLTATAWAFFWLPVGMGVLTWVLIAQGYRSGEMSLGAALLAGAVFGGLFPAFGVYFLRRGLYGLVFDKSAGVLRRGIGGEYTLDPGRSSRYVLPLDQLSGIQVLEKVEVRSRAAVPYKGGRQLVVHYMGELNAILRNGSRAHLFNSGDVVALEQCAQELSQFLDKPIMASPDYERKQQSPETDWSWVSEEDKREYAVRRKSEMLLGGVAGVIALIIGVLLLWQGAQDADWAKLASGLFVAVGGMWFLISLPSRIGRKIDDLVRMSKYLEYLERDKLNKT
jgi:hypothetical protein